MCMTLGELAEALGAELKGGDPSAEVLGIAGLEDVGPGQVSYVQDARLLRRGEATPALALIAPEDCASEIKPLLSAADPRLAFAHALRILVPAGPPLQGAHPTAVIGEDVALGEGAAIKLKDSASLSNPKLVKKLRDIAKKKRIKYQLEILPRGGTDSGALQRSRGGAAVCTISVPTRYVHSVVEMAHKKDIEASIKLLAAFLNVAHEGNYTL